MPKKENNKTSSTQKFLLYLFVIWGIFLLGSLFGVWSTNQTATELIALHIFILFLALIISFILSRDPVGSKSQQKNNAGKRNRDEVSKSTESNEENYSVAYWAFVSIMGLYLLLYLIAWGIEGFKLDILIQFVISSFVLASALRVIYFIFALIYRRITGIKQRDSQTEEESSENGKTLGANGSQEEYGEGSEKTEKIEWGEKSSRTEGKKDKPKLKEDFEGIKLGKVKNYWGFTSREDGFAKVKFNNNVQKGHTIRICGENREFVQSLKAIKQHGQQINDIASGEEYNIEVKNEVEVGDIVKSEEIPSCSNKSESKETDDGKTESGTDSKENPDENIENDKNGEADKLPEKKERLLQKLIIFVKKEIEQKEEGQEEISSREDTEPAFRSITPKDLDSPASDKDFISVENNSETEKENEVKDESKTKEKSLDTGLMPSSLEDDSRSSEENKEKNTDGDNQNSTKTDLENGAKTAKPISEDISVKSRGLESTNYEILERQKRKDFDKTTTNSDKRISYEARIDYSMADNDRPTSHVSHVSPPILDYIAQNLPDEESISLKRTKNSRQQYNYQRSLSIYAKQIETEILDREGEKDLAQKIEKGSIKARKELARHNLRLVISRAKRFRGSGLPFVDLIQEGNLGLMKAVERFDHRKGTKFSTYGVNWIEQRIRRALNRHARMVRLPAHIISTQRKALQIKKRERDRGNNISNKEIAERLETSTSKVKKALMHRNTYKTLDRRKEVVSVRHEKKTFSKRSFERTTLRQKFIRRLKSNFESQSVQEKRSRLSQLVPSKHTFDPELKARKDEQKNKLFRLMDERLTERERRIVMLRFGLKGNKVSTLEEVGRIFGISRERVRQLQNRAIEELQELLDRGELNFLVRNPKKSNWKYSQARKFGNILLEFE